MKIKNYEKLKFNVKIMNEINDDISLIEWNNSDGPKFESVEEMKDFYERLKNNELDYLFTNEYIETNDIPNTKDIIIESYKHTLDNIYFYLYTFKNNSSNEYITYLSLKKLNENYFLNNLCGNCATDKKSAHKYFEKIKNSINTTNNIDDILEDLIIGTENTIKLLKNKLNSLTN